MTITVADVLNEVRILVQFSNQANIPDSTLLQYLNRWWQISLPQGFTHFALKSVYQFTTVAGQPNYAFPIDQYLNLAGGVYCDGIRLAFYQDANQFGNAFLINRTNTTVALGNGTVGAYTGTIKSIPLIPGFTDAFGNVHPQVFLTTTSNVGSQLQLTDDGNGNLVGDGSGTINYTTGVFSAIFSLPVSNSAIIYGDTTFYSRGRPWAVLFFQNTLTFRAVPDKPYVIACNVYQIPSEFTSTTQTIPINQYFDIMARGTALRVAKTLKDQQQTDLLQKMYAESLQGVKNITSRQSANQRPSTQFYMPQGAYNNQSWANNPASFT